MIDKTPFDGTNPAEVMADEFRIKVCELAQTAYEVADYRSLSSVEQVQSFMGGVLTGLIGVCFAHVSAEGRDAMMEAITDYLPQARAQAEGIIHGAALNASGVQ